NGPSEIPMPPPNPATRGDEPVVADATPARHRKHELKHEAKPELVARTAETPERVAVKSSHDGKRMMAVIDVKPASKGSTHSKQTRTASNDKLKIMRPEATTLQLAAQKTKGSKATSRKRTAAGSGKSNQPLRIANAGR
ncbi:MAG: hypothetical protein ACTHLY_17190, partial [Pseudolabrys sp.]